jgi:hypothetical protein
VDPLAEFSRPIGLPWFLRLQPHLAGPL